MNFTSVFTKEKQKISMPRIFLHIEGLVLFSLTLYLYEFLGYSWKIFFYWLLVPDFPLFLYRINKNFASIFYNILHSFSIPLLLLLFSFLNSYQFGIQLSIIWFAHIGMDKLFGYGLKYLGKAKENHFSRV